MPLTRRDVLIASAVWAVLGCGRSGRPAPALQQANLFLGGGQYRAPPDEAVHYVLSAIDLSAGEPSRNLTATSFLPHGIHAHPQTPARLAVFEKMGPGACEYDLRERKILRAIPPVENRYFYGHGTYTADGRHLLSTEADRDAFNGAIGIRDSDSLAYLGAFPSYGKAPHECRLTDDGKTLVVTNGGGDLHGDAPCVTYIDVASQKLLDRVSLEDARLNTGHFAITQDGSLVVVSAPRKGLPADSVGGIALRAPGGVLQSLSSGSRVATRLQGESLSVAIHEDRHIAAVTHPDGDLVTFWSLTTRELLRSLKVHKPRGVALSTEGDEFIISAGEQASLIRVPVDTLEPFGRLAVVHSFMTGSHIYNWSRGMSEVLTPGPLAGLTPRAPDQTVI